MAAGAKHFGVNAEYINFLETHENQPRRTPDQFQGWEVPEGTPVMTEEEVTKLDGKDGRDIVLVINGKVLKCIAEKDTPAMQAAHFVRGMVGGAHAEVSMAANLYDPKYGAPTKLEDFTREHAAYREDFFYTDA